MLLSVVNCCMTHFDFSLKLIPGVHSIFMWGVLHLPTLVFLLHTLTFTSAAHHKLDDIFLTVVCLFEVRQSRDHHHVIVLDIPRRVGLFVTRYIDVNASAIVEFPALNKRKQKLSIYSN